MKDYTGHSKPVTKDYWRCFSRDYIYLYSYQVFIDTYIWKVCRSATKNIDNVVSNFVINRHNKLLDTCYMTWPCLCLLSIVGLSWLWTSNDQVAHGHNWSILAVTSHVQLWPCSTMLGPSVHTLTKVIRCDRMWPSMAHSCMAGAFVSDLWECQLKTIKIHWGAFIWFQFLFG